MAASNTGVLITDGGPHPADKWAMHIAEKVVPLDNVKIGNRPALALKLQLAVVEALTTHLESAQVEEVNRLRDNPEHFNAPHALDPYVDPMMTDIIGAAQSTPWADHFNDSTVQSVIHDMLTQHALDVLHIERLWHADRNPENEHGRTYKAKFALAVPA